MPSKFFSSLLIAATFAAGSTAAFAAPLTECDLAQGNTAGIKLGGTLTAQHDAARKMYVLNHEPHQNKMVSGGLFIPLKKLPGMQQLQGECSLVICNASLKGSTQVSGKLLFDIYSSSNKAAAGFTVSSERYHHHRKINFANSALPMNFTPGKPLKLTLTVNLDQQNWVGTVTEDGKLLFTTGLQKLADNFAPDFMRVIATSNSRNDGLQILVTDLAVNGSTESDDDSSIK
ncbi:MAG: hypothetical protein E7047_10250 [Lentisphaerae bacterium]|nr:hypothetical protein [Lentisphaerota bacterium]